MATQVSDSPQTQIIVFLFDSMMKKADTIYNGHDIRNFSDTQIYDLQGRTSYYSIWTSLSAMSKPNGYILIPICR